MKLSNFSQVDEYVQMIPLSATIFAALTHHAGIKAAIVCVALLNRLNCDQVRSLKIVIIILF